MNTAFRTTLLCVLCLLLSAFALASDVKGARVQNFVVKNKEVKITILNQSDQPITGYTVRIEMTLPDGSQTFEEKTEDVGPRGKKLPAHESVVKTYDLGDEASVVKPRIVVVIYNNGTAESEKKETLDQILSVRQKAVRDLKLTPDEIKTYVNVVDINVSTGIGISVETPNGMESLKGISDDQQAGYIRASIALNKVLALNVSPSENTGRLVTVRLGTSTAVEIDVGRKPL